MTDQCRADFLAGSWRKLQPPKRKLTELRSRHEAFLLGHAVIVAAL